MKSNLIRGSSFNPAHDLLLIDEHESYVLCELNGLSITFLSSSGLSKSCLSDSVDLTMESTPGETCDNLYWLIFLSLKNSMYSA